MRVLMVYGGHPRIGDTGSEEHMGLAYLTANLRSQGHQVEIIDGSLRSFSPRRLLSEVWHRRHSFDLLGFSCPFSDSLASAGWIASTLRRRGLTQHFTMGGHPPTFLAARILEKWPAFDSVVMGEGEETLALLVSRVEEGRDWWGLQGLAVNREGEPAVNPPRPLLGDLDALPFPARDTLKSHSGDSQQVTASVLKSRGCYGRCSFCDTAAFYRASPGSPWRSRSPSNVADELEELVRDHKVSYVRFWDDNFIGPGKKGRRLATQLAEAIMERNIDIKYAMESRVDNVEEGLFSLLKESGLKSVFLGIESGVQRALDTFEKGVTVEQNVQALETLRGLGLEVKIGFILLDPYTTLEELMENLDWLREHVGPMSHIRRILTQPLNILEVYEGAPIMERLKDDGLLRGSFAGYRYRFADTRIEILVRALVVLRRIGLSLRDALAVARSMFLKAEEV